MNWDAIGAVGEIIGAFAVFITLVYLSVQVKQNIKLAKASIRESRIDSSQKIILFMSDSAELFAKSIRGEKFSIEESFRMNMMTRAMFRDWEGYSYQNKQGLLDDSEWAAMKETWTDIMRSDLMRSKWEKFKPQYSKLLHDDLIDILHPYTKEEPAED